MIVTHDAEDLIHPEELRWINYYSGRFDFVQTPVLPLPTPLRKFTHGIYCDEFAEYHTRDMTVRPISGGFVPSSGVGTGYRRDALETLARARNNQIFEPEALTEDYVNGLRLFRLGCTQTFRAVVAGDQPAGLRRHARIFSADLAHGAAAAHPLGHRDRAPGLAAIRMEGHSGRGVLAVAGPQGIDRESAQPAGQCAVPVRPGNRGVDPHERDAARGSASRHWDCSCCAWRCG